LVRGDLVPDSGTITARIRRSGPGTRRRSSGDSSLGRHAVTHYVVRKRFGAATLVSVTLETGRTHQIRIHLADRGHPVVGDRVYGTLERSPPHPALDRFPRQALHAARLGFAHPATGKWLEFDSPLPADFAGLLQSLGSPREGNREAPSPG